MVRRLDGHASVGDIADQLTAQYPSSHAEIHPALERLIADLSQSGMLAMAAGQTNDVDHESAVPARRHATWRWPALNWLRPPARRAGEALRRHPRVAVAVEIILVIAAATALVTRLLTEPFVLPGAISLVAFLLYLLHLVAHELAHAVAASAIGAPPREMGVALLFRVVPVLYVDRTNTLTVTRRWPRAQVSLAGPAVDVVGAGLTAVLASATEGRVSATLALLSAFQVLSLAANVFPLFPGDGSNAIEALTGRLAVRKHAREAFGSLVLRRPLPPWLARTTRVKLWSLCALHGVSLLAALIFVVLLAIRIGSALLTVLL